MKWMDFIIELDAVRTEIRSTKNLKAEIAHPDAVIDKLFNLLAEEPAAKPAPTPLAAVLEFPDDGLAACAPEAAPIIEERGPGEGRMIVYPRDTPLIIREPVVEETTEEGLGK